MLYRYLKVLFSFSYVIYKLLYVFCMFYVCFYICFTWLINHMPSNGWLLASPRRLRHLARLTETCLRSCSVTMRFGSVQVDVECDMCPDYWLDRGMRCFRYMFYIGVCRVHIGLLMFYIGFSSVGGWTALRHPVRYLHVNIFVHCSVKCCFLRGFWYTRVRL